KVVGEVEGLAPLVAIAQALHARVAGREQILHADPVRAPDPHGESDIDAVDDLAADVAGADPAARALAGHEVGPPGRVEHEALAEDRAQPEEPFRSDPVVVVSLLLAAHGARRAEPDAADERPLERDLSREPPLADRAQPERRRRDAEDLGREIVEDAEEPEDPAIVVAELVV